MLKIIFKFFLTLLVVVLVTIWMVALNIPDLVQYMVTFLIGAIAGWFYIPNRNK